MAIISEGAHIFVEDITLSGIRDAITAWHTTDLRSKFEKYHGQHTEAVFHAWTDEHSLPEIKCPVLVIQGD